MVRTPICLQEGVAIDQYVSNKYSSANLVRKRTSRLVFDALNEGECEVAVVSLLDYEKFRRNIDVNGDCSLWWSGRVEQYVLSGLATAVDTGDFCTSLIDHVLDYHIMQMKFDGFFVRVMNDYLTRTGDLSCVSEETALTVAALEEEEEEDTTSLTLREMSGIFIVHAFLCFFALALALVKFCCVRRKKIHQSVRTMISNRSLWISQADAGLDSSDDNLTSQAKKTASQASSMSVLTDPDDNAASPNLPVISESGEEQQSLVSQSRSAELDEEQNPVSPLSNGEADEEQQREPPPPPSEADEEQSFVQSPWKPEPEEEQYLVSSPKERVDRKDVTFAIRETL